MTGLSLLLFAIVSTAFLALLGYGPTKLLLPREWRSDEALLAPLLGYVLLLVIGYYGVRTALNLVGVLILCTALAIVLAGLALWLRREERLDLNLREHGPVWLLALVAFFLAVFPLIHYGYLTPIGENWDPENYLPVTEYLVRVPLDQIEEMPVNPLRELNASPPRIGLTLGFSILQGVLEQLRGWDARQSFAPTLALLRGLTVLALYVLFRWGLRMERWPAFWATLLGGFHALGLWITFFNFGMQMAATPLLPLALTLFLVALRQPGWRTVLLAAVAVASLPVTYYPALTVFVPLALGSGLYELVRSEQRWQVLLAGLSTALLAAAFAWGTILDYGAGFSYRYSQQMTTLGLFRFVSLGEWLGFVQFTRSGHDAYALWNLLWNLGQVGGILVVILGLAALWRSRWRWLWLAMLIPGFLYLGWLRGWFWYAATSWKIPLGEQILNRIEPYPYALMKGTAFVAPLLLALAVEGLGQIWELPGRWRGVRVGRAVLAGLLLFPLVLTLWADGRLVARYWERPAHFDQEVLQVEEAVALIPEGAAVYLTGRPERSRPVLGMWAYFLREHPLYGRFSTAYTGWDDRVPGDAPAYALLDADDTPFVLGFFPEQRLWAGGGMVLYERDPTVVSFLDLRSDAYGRHPPEVVHTRKPLAERLLQTFGDYAVLSPEQPLVLFADAERLSLDDNLAGTPGTRSLGLALAAFEQVWVTLRWDDGTEETFVAGPGFDRYYSEPHALPARVEVLPQGEAPVWPCWAVLSERSSSLGPLSLQQEVLFLPEVTADGAVLEIDVRIANYNGRRLRLALEVWENTFEDAEHYAWWGLLPLPERGTVHLRADLAEREAQAWIGEEEVSFPPHPGADDWPFPSHGSYFVALWVYYGHHVIEVLPVGHFHIEAEQQAPDAFLIKGMEDLVSIDVPFRLLWPHSPAEQSGASFGSVIRLLAYERGAGPFEAGDSVPLALEWHALEEMTVDYFVTAQILGEGRLWGQWDGLAGQWLPTTTWEPPLKDWVVSLRDDIPLRIDPETPPGRYRLIVAVYDVATGQRLLAYSSEGEKLGDALDLGEVVVR